MSRLAWVCVGFLLIAAFFLVTEHTAHFFGVLPYLLLLACPLLHWLSHGRHGGPGGERGRGHEHGQAMLRKEAPR